MRRRGRGATTVRVAAVLSALALVLGGCGGGSGGSGGSGGGGEAATGEPDRDGTLRLAQLVAPQVFDPRQAASQIPAQSYLGPVYDKLLDIDSDLEVVPMLATDWDLADDQMSLELELRDDVSFHDGAPFDADAVVANLEAARAADDNIAGSLMEPVAAVTAVDPATVRLDFTEPTQDFVLVLATYIQVSGMASPDALDDPASLATDPVGTGPYRLERALQDRAVYERVDGYWDPEVDARAPQTLEIISITDSNAAQAALVSGQVDAMIVDAPIPDVEGFAASNDLVITPITDTGRTYSIKLNSSSGPLADVRVRQAISKAIDRRALADSVLAGACEPTLQALPPSSPSFDDDLVVDDDTYDPDGARALLAEAGHEQVTLVAGNLENTSFQRFGTAVQAQLAEVGITLEITNYPATEGNTAFTRGDAELMFTSAAGAVDPSATLEQFHLGPTNPPGLDWDDATALHEAARALPLGSAERDEAYRELFALMVAEPLHIEVCLRPITYIAHPRVQGIEDTAFGQLQSAWDYRSLSVAQR